MTSGRRATPKAPGENNQGEPGAILVDASLDTQDGNDRAPDIGRLWAAPIYGEVKTRGIKSAETLFCAVAKKSFKKTGG